MKTISNSDELWILPVNSKKKKSGQRNTLFSWTLKLHFLYWQQCLSSPTINNVLNYKCASVNSHILLNFVYFVVAICWLRISSTAVSVFFTLSHNPNQLHVTLQRRGSSPSTCNAMCCIFLCILHTKRKKYQGKHTHKQHENIGWNSSFLFSCQSKDANHEIIVVAITTVKSGLFLWLFSLLKLWL